MKHPFFRVGLLFLLPGTVFLRFHPAASFPTSATGGIPEPNPELVLGRTTVRVLASWDFDAEEVPGWQPNAHLAAKVENGVLKAEAVDWDPFFTCENLSIQTNPWQLVLVRLKADEPGYGELFWTGTEQGKYGGFTPEKRTRFRVPGTNDWEEIAIFPFWHTEKEIRKLRLDLFGGARFEIHSIRVLEWGGSKKPLTDVYRWNLAKNADGWVFGDSIRERFAPPLDLDLTGRDWVTLTIRSNREGTATFLWACGKTPGLQTRSFRVRGDGGLHHYNLELGGISTWKTPLLALGIRLPGSLVGSATLENVSLADVPSGPPEVYTEYFGFEDAVHHAGDRCHLLGHFVNEGGGVLESASVTLELSEGLRLVPEENPVRPLDRLSHEDHAYLRWTVVAAKPGIYEATLVSSVSGIHTPAGVRLRFDEDPGVPPSRSVPSPNPVTPDLEVCMYYFPGWDSPAKWDPIRLTAPIRKPLLGYYNEGDPECVDWQIKWAVENGVTCFVVDWYWDRGKRILTHWLEAYRRAEHRDHLKIALMWANHNPPGSHSVEDFLKVTRHWIENFFEMNTYYRIDHRPAVFIWDPQRIREDLGGSETVAAVFRKMQDRAVRAGFEGICFVALHDHRTKAQAERLFKEGYSGATNYHEWGKAESLAATPQEMSYRDVVATAPGAWEDQSRICGELTYFPVVETGWDARPWHGRRARVIRERTPDLFEELLIRAKEFCRSKKRRMVLLGPGNEWGEGSYIEPCTEFGFEMYNRVRKVFCRPMETPWPPNLAPADVGLGPYDFPQHPPRTRWTFDRAADGWKALMHVTPIRVEGGVLKFATTSSYAALLTDTPGLSASAWSSIMIRMRLEGDDADRDVGQIFWARPGRPMTESSSIRFPVRKDGSFHDYQILLSENPRWRGTITGLRLDPCATAGVEVRIDEIRFRESRRPLRDERIR